MLEATFIHIPGIGPVTERRLWAEGITHWRDLGAAIAARDRVLKASPHGLNAIQRELATTMQAWEQGDHEYFAKRLPQSELYRLACSVPAETVFLDIETTGLSEIYHVVTMIGVWKNGHFTFSLNGDTAENLNATIEKSACLVTFNGTRFDIPFLKRHFPEIQFPAGHIDLMYLARRMGMQGGQKSIEKQLGFKRPDDVIAQRGENAPALWYAYTYGDLDSGRLLVRYNEYDIIGMRFILDKLISTLVSHFPKIVQNKLPSDCCFLLNSLDEETANVARSVKPYHGPVGPKARIGDLTKHSTRPLRVVGIDLTGSERRPTGWCSLAGIDAETRLLKSDEEILQATLDAKPDLVSIDSPLSLPTGRDCVSDNDPARPSAGITRYCERELKRRGVNVYPCLIQSMQQLTARGMKLAEKLRAVGVPVIESYPGAAQDIIGLPRKGESLDLLKRGLSGFGVRGEFQSQKVSHDEIDAITSAVVGVFFWAGRFEALGNSQEDYLIVPDLRVDAIGWRQRCVIGISGSIASGKTTAACHLRDQKGFEYRRYSSVLADLLRKNGLEATRANLQEYGDYVNKELGQRWLCKRLFERISADGNVVVDGLRFPEDRAFLVERFGPSFLHLHVVSAKDSRRSRHIAMGFGREEFAQINAHSVERSIEALRSWADVVVENEQDRASFLKSIDSVIAGLGKGCPEGPLNGRKDNVGERRYGRP